jgi:hypothetical protein
LIHLDAGGRELTDTYHDDLEAALAQAEWELGVRSEEWQALEADYD